MKVRASADGEEETLLYYDADAKRAGLRFHPQRRATAARWSSAPRSTLKPGEPLKLRVFVDKSVVEVYANDRQAIGRRVYPDAHRQPRRRPVRHGGSAAFKTVKAWEMMPSNPY